MVPSGKYYCITNQGAADLNYDCPYYTSLAYIRNADDFEDWKFMRGKQVTKWENNNFLTNFFFSDKSSTDLRVNAYFDTPSNDLDCDDITNNCGDKVKFWDHSLWTFLPEMKVSFKNKPAIKIKGVDHSYEFSDANYNDYNRLVCVLDCCKLISRNFFSQSEFQVFPSCIFNFIISNLGFYLSVAR